MRTHPTLNLFTAASFLLFGLLFASLASADTVLGPDDFESDFGNWTNLTSDVFDWTRNSGSTTSTGTGPSGDHTSGSGYYAYTEASSPRAQGDDAILESPCIDLTGASDADLDFWYHMYGTAMGTLDVQVASSTGASCGSLGGYSSVWSLSGDQGDVWTAANVPLTSYVGGSIQIHFIGVIGSSYTSDMAIDDVEVTATLGPECIIDEDCNDLHNCTINTCNPVTQTCESENVCVEGQASYVIQISVDGLASYLLETRINSPGYENFKRFVDEGATTFDARADYTHTWTMPAHISMVTSRPVEQPAGQPNTVHHGYTDNNDPDPSWTLHDDQWNPNVPYIASTWDVAHDNGLVTALYASKTKFVIFEQSYDSDSGAPDTTGPDNGTDKIDYYHVQTTAYWDPAVLDAYQMHQQFIADMGANHFNYTFLCYADPDPAGHQYGWGSAQWDAAVKHVNGYLGEVFDLILSDPVLNGHTVVLLTADHGGSGTGHGNETLPQEYRLPLFVWGAGVDAGVDLYAMNPLTRQDPIADIPPGGDPVARPDYDAAPQPLRMNDSGNLALHHLGLGPIPGSSVNDDQDVYSQASQEPFTAYNDCVYDAALSDTDPNGQAVHYKADNTTIYGIGTICSDCGSTGSGTPYSISSGRLVNISDGKPTPVTVSVSESNGVNWQSQVGPTGSPVAGNWSGGYDTASGTDARDTFGGIADMTGTVYYGSTGWWVDLVFTGLDPAKSYTFATSASRASANTDGPPGYDDRITIYSLSGVDASSNASTAGVTEISPTQVSFCTGNNHAEGYVARWTGIDPGSDGAFTVRAEADTSSSDLAYAFDVFMLEEQSGDCGDGGIDAGEQCDDGNTADGDCCSSTCQYEASGSACGDPGDTVCDDPDTCDGSGACQPNYEPGTTECRPDAGACDVAENCDGAGSCPADVFEPAGTACGDPGDTVCDDPDTCDGSGACQANPEPPTTVCRPSLFGCDATEFCDGSGSCPADALKPPGSPCGDPGDTVCDDPDTCDVAGACQANHAPSTTECRPDTGECDIAENCDGSGSCPADVFEPAGTACGEPGDTVCDNPDSCDGSGACQPNFEPPTTLCRAPAGVCDAPDYCDGASPDCPPDAKKTSVCRESTYVCDAPEVCDGVSDYCLRDLPANGSPCPDGDLCNGSEMCIGWVCTPGDPPKCDDELLCTADRCDAVLGCVNEPIQGLGQCWAQVPSASPAGRLLLSLLVAGAGAAFLARSRRLGA